MPIAVVISNLISFVIRFVIFLLFLAYFMLAGADVHPNWWILSLPLLALIMALMGLGFGIIVSSLTTKYRDLQQLVGFGVQLLMYATPVIYPLSSIEGGWRWLILANPMTPIVEVFRRSAPCAVTSTGFRQAQPTSSVQAPAQDSLAHLPSRSPALQRTHEVPAAERECGASVGGLAPALAGGARAVAGSAREAPPRLVLTVRLSLTVSKGRRLELTEALSFWPGR